MMNIWGNTNIMEANYGVNFKKLTSKKLISYNGSLLTFKLFISRRVYLSRYLIDYLEENDETNKFRHDLIRYY